MFDPESSTGRSATLEFEAFSAKDHRETFEAALSKLELEFEPTVLLLERSTPYETPVLLIYPRSSDPPGQGAGDSELDSGGEPRVLLLERDTPGESPVLLIYLPPPASEGPTEDDRGT